MKISPTEFIKKFFKNVPEEYKIALLALPSQMTEIVSLKSLDELDSGIEAANEMTQNTYFSVCPLKPSFVGPGRGKVSDIGGLSCFWVDIDIQGPAHKATNLPPDFDAAADLLSAVSIDPSVVVDTGYGLHAYWVLDKFIPLDYKSMRRRRFLETCIKNLQNSIIDKAKRLGFHVDATHDLARVMRLPGSYNFKLPEKPALVSTLEDSWGTIPAEVMFEELAVVDPYFHTIVKHLNTGFTSANEADFPEVEQPPAVPVGDGKLVNIDEVRLRLRDLQNPYRKQLLGKVLDGESFAVKGERDRVLQVVCSTIAYCAPEARADQLVQILKPSLSKWASEAGATLTLDGELRKAQEKISRALHSARDARKRDEKLREVIENKIPVLKQTSYSPDDLIKVAGEQRCSVEELDRRWIIQYKSTYYCLINGKYVPYSREELNTGYVQWFSKCPWDIYVPNAKGDGERILRLEEVLQAHATVANRAEASFSLQLSYYDSEEGVFYEAVRPLRKLQPLYDPKIDAWIELLGGDEKERLKDWIATVSDLTQPAAALYLSGKPEIGKTLLADGLSRLWSLGGPANLGRVLDNFNDDLIKCPLVFADEYLPPSALGRRRTSTELRDLVASDYRSLNRKFLPVIGLHGHIRLMMAANNENLLSFTEESLSSNDLEAYKERFIHIDGSLAHGFFAQFPDKRAPEGWVRGDGIAKYALYLASTRNVLKSGRFAVKGTPSKIHSQIATGGRVGSLVVEWLAKYMLASDAERSLIGKMSKDKVLLGDGKFLVNAAAIIQNWTKFVSTAKSPTLSQVGMSLATLSTGEILIGGSHEFRDIDISLVYNWIDRTQMGDLELAKAYANRKINLPLIFERIENEKLERRKQGAR